MFLLFLVLCTGISSKVQANFEYDYKSRSISSFGKCKLFKASSISGGHSSIKESISGIVFVYATVGAYYTF